MSLSRRCMALVLASILPWLLTSCASTGGGKGEPGPSRDALVLNAPGAALEDGALLVAAQLRNTTKEPVRVTIDSAGLESASLATEAPISVGEIPAGASAVVQVGFKDAASLRPGEEYRLTLHGTFEDVRTGVRHAFLASQVIVLPPAGPGSGQAKAVTVRPEKTSGARSSGGVNDAGGQRGVDVRALFRRPVPRSG